ncbi:hypothetical protein P886_1068 [Alteromonadaceae bacterium 2753L.S.0a.02]|nr:hypothetical protein P886_1068 [Alteromonadaceae bacterium 2753L.S.0a.02]
MYFSQPSRFEEFVLLSYDATNAKSISLSEWLSTKNNVGGIKSLGTILGFYYGIELNAFIHANNTSFKRVDVQCDDQMQNMLQMHRIDGFVVEKTVALQMKKIYLTHR